MLLVSTRRSSPPRCSCSRLAPAALAAPPKASTSIVGGQAADIDDWPSIAFLLSAWDADGDGDLDEQAQCTGTVIAPQWVVSAAHCAFTPNDELVDAMLTMTGDGDTDDLSGEVIAADRLVVHRRLGSGVADRRRAAHPPALAAAAPPPIPSRSPASTT